MVVQTRMVIVDARDRSYSFRVQIHKAESPAEQLIEPAFYQQFAGEVHKGIHFEMELVESPVWGRIDPNVPIHIHQNPETGQNFVCISARIETLEAALGFLLVWCVGTVFTLTRNSDFVWLAQKHGGDFIDIMRDHYLIVISGDMEIPG